jgi:hypothetical protein
MINLGQEIRLYDGRFGIVNQLPSLTNDLAEDVIGVCLDDFCSVPGEDANLTVQVSKGDGWTRYDPIQKVTSCGNHGLET